MKIITYHLYNDGSHKPIVPDAVKRIRRESGEDLRAGKSLVDYIESFNDGKPNKCIDKTLIRDNPHRLFLGSEISGGNIAIRIYYGWHTPDFDPARGSDPDCGCFTTVTVNEYDETNTRVAIVEDGCAEYLEPVPVYVPVEGVPGLYEQVK